ATTEIYTLPLHDALPISHAQTHTHSLLWCYGHSRGFFLCLPLSLYLQGGVGVVSDLGLQSIEQRHQATRVLRSVVDVGEHHVLEGDAAALLQGKAPAGIDD